MGNLNYAIYKLNLNKSYNTNFILTSFPKVNMFNWSNLAFVDLLNNNVYYNRIKFFKTNYALKSNFLITQKLNLLQSFFIRLYTQPKQTIYQKTNLHNLLNFCNKSSYQSY